MKYSLIIILLVSLFSCKQESPEKGKILILVSNTENMGDPEEHFAGNNLKKTWRISTMYT